MLAELYIDMAELKALSVELGLSYRWLPLYLFWEFQRANASEASGESLDIKLSVPENLQWAGGTKRSRRPKNGEKQQDPLERDVMWLYRSEIKRPPETTYALGKEYASREGLEKRFQDSTIENAIARVKARLACGD